MSTRVEVCGAAAAAPPRGQAFDNFRKLRFERNTLASGTLRAGPRTGGA